MSDLHAATTKELIDELSRRNDSVVVCAARKSLDANNENEYMTYWSGSIFVCIGMIADLQHELLSRDKHKDDYDDENFGS